MIVSRLQRDWLQEKKLEGVEAELDQTQSDLQLAFKRIADLQATLEDQILRDSDEEYSDDRLLPTSSISSAYKFWAAVGDVCL